jgi:hypothetical protein
VTEGGSSRGWLSRVQAQVAQLGKKKKEEADQLEAALSARHAAELTALDAGGSAGDDDTPAAAASAKLNALALDDDDTEEVRHLFAPPRVLKEEGVWKAATSKSDPRRLQDWILNCLQGERAHPLAACGVATLCCSPPAAGNSNALPHVDSPQDGGGRKLSKQRKRKEAKQKADDEREERIEREKAEMGDSDRVLEEQVREGAC